jgi:hypothetical protein
MIRGNRQREDDRALRARLRATTGPERERPERPERAPLAGMLSRPCLLVGVGDWSLCLSSCRLFGAGGGWPVRVAPVRPHLTAIGALCLSDRWAVG